MEILYALLIVVLMLDGVLSDVWVRGDPERGWKLSFWMGMLFIFPFMFVAADHSSSTEFVLTTCFLFFYNRWFCTRPADYYGVVWPAMVEAVDKVRENGNVDYKAEVKKKLKEIFRK